MLRHSVRVATSNDLKLSDCGGWRAGCMVGGKAAAEAASVTAGAVRCSALLGDVLEALLLGEMERKHPLNEEQIARAKECGRRALEWMETGYILTGKRTNRSLSSGGPNV